VPKIIDYPGRFAFFELASFTVVRDHGVDRLSRHAIAQVLATSISTVRRLLAPEADLRCLALNEVAVRRRRRIRTSTGATGVEAGLRLVRQLLPDGEAYVAEELVWWRLAVSAPTDAVMPPDQDTAAEGPLHHRFSIANYGYVSGEVLGAAIEPPRSTTTPDGRTDPIVEARRERHQDLAHRLTEAVRVVAPALDPAAVAREGRILHALVDGLGVTVSLGLLSPNDAVTVLGDHLQGLAHPDAR
jgi:hypothetical protein